MRTIAVVSRKGGAGKSTIAAHLSVLASADDAPAFLIDTDPQGSLAFWHSIRDADVPILAKAEARELPDLLSAARSDGIAWAIVDAPPHNSPDIARVVDAADLVLIPTRPAAFDLAAVSATLELVAANDRPALVIINAAPPRRTLEASLVSEARGVLRGMTAGTRAAVWPGQITNRAALAHALTGGLAVAELEPEGKAAGEVSALWRAVRDHGED